MRDPGNEVAKFALFCSKRGLKSQLNFSLTNLALVCSKRGSHAAQNFYLNKGELWVYTEISCMSHVTGKNLFRLAGVEGKLPLINFQNEIIEMDVARGGVEEGMEKGRGCGSADRLLIAIH